MEFEKEKLVNTDFILNATGISSALFKKYRDMKIVDSFKDRRSRRGSEGEPRGFEYSYSIRVIDQIKRIQKESQKKSLHKIQVDQWEENRKIRIKVEEELKQYKKEIYLDVADGNFDFSDPEIRRAIETLEHSFKSKTRKEIIRSVFLIFPSPTPIPSPQKSLPFEDDVRSGTSREPNHTIKFMTNLSEFRPRRDS